MNTVALGNDSCAVNGDGTGVAVNPGAADTSSTGIVICTSVADGVSGIILL